MRPEKGNILTDPVARSIHREQMQNAMPVMVECDDCGAEHNEDVPCPRCEGMPTREELGP